MPTAGPPPRAAAFRPRPIPARVRHRLFSGNGVHAPPIDPGSSSPVVPPDLRPDRRPRHARLRRPRRGPNDRLRGRGRPPRDVPRALPPPLQVDIRQYVSDVGTGGSLRVDQEGPLSRLSATLPSPEFSPETTAGSYRSPPPAGFGDRLRRAAGMRVRAPHAPPKYQRGSSRGSQSRTRSRRASCVSRLALTTPTTPSWQTNRM